LSGSSERDSVARFFARALSLSLHLALETGALSMQERKNNRIVVATAGPET